MVAKFNVADSPYKLIKTKLLQRFALTQSLSKRIHTLIRQEQKARAIDFYSKSRSNPSQKRSQGEAPQRVLYFNLWRV